MTLIKHVIIAHEHFCFAPAAFASQVGRRIRFRVADRVTTAVILDVKVAEDHASAELTLDVDDPLPELRKDLL